MAKSTTSKILSHPDREEIISKMLLGISTKDIYDNLNIRYADVGDPSLIISEKELTTFKKNSLDIYRTIQEDLHKTSTALANKDTNNVDLAVKSSPKYKEAMIKLANNELDIKTMLANLILSVENRVAQISDQIQQDPDTINSKTERLLAEYIDRLQNGIERWQKYIVGTPDQTIQHNVSIQHIDSHISVFYEAIRKTLSQMDIETSLYFMEVFNEEINKLKAPVEQKITPAEERLAEVKILNDQINQQLTEDHK